MKTMVCPKCWGAKCDHCSNNGFIADLQLSKDFWLSEMVKSDIAARNGISNAPTQVEIAHCQQLVTGVLQPLRDSYGKPIFVSSGIRMPALNAKIGGSPAHPSGFAADIHSTETRKELVDFLVGMKVPFDQIIFEGTWVHVSRFSPDGSKARGEVLATFDGGKSFVKYDPNDPRINS